MSLAIFTGKPAFSRKLYTGSPIMEEDTKRRYFEYMEGVFDRNYYTNNGPLVSCFEEKIAQLHNVRHCVAFCNATIAQILLLKAMGLEGEIILPSFTFVATAHACIWQNLKPIFCDISPDTLMITPETVKNAMTRKACAVIGVHLFGNLCDSRALEVFASENKLRLIFDAAHAFNCSRGDTVVGSSGEAEFLSFHATKFLGTFEGGAVLTNNSDLAKNLRDKRNFGFCGYDSVDFLGLNGKMSESSAAMGLASLDAINSRTERCRKSYMTYRDAFSALPGIKVLNVGEEGRSNYHYLVISVSEKEFGVSRDTLTETLWKENVYARKYFYPGCHRLKYYSSLNTSQPELPVTDDASNKVLCLPSGFANPEKEIGKIKDIFLEVHVNAEKINENMISN